MIKKAVMIFVLFLLLSSFFAIAQETDDPYADETVEECGFGCKVWQFLFGSKEARAGRAWFDRSEAVVGKGSEQNIDKAKNLFKEGRALFDENKYQEALIKFQEADKIKSSPTSKGMIAASLDSIKGKETEAKIAWQAFLNSKPENNDRFSESITYAKTKVTEDYIPIWSKEKNSEFETPGTLYKNDNNEFFITGKDGKGVKLTDKQKETALENLNKANGENLNFNADAANSGVLGKVLGASASGFEKSIGKITQTSTDGKTSVIVGEKGTITVREVSDGSSDAGVKVVERSLEGKLLETSVVKDGQIIASQKGTTVKVGDREFTVEEDAKIADIFKPNGKSLALAGKEESPYGGKASYENGVLTAVDYDNEKLERIDTNSKQREAMNINYYPEGVSGCKDDGGCVLETSGVIYIIDKKGREVQAYNVDVDYKGTGADRQLEQTEYFNPRTGKLEGIKLPDGASVFAQKDEKGNYNGEFELKSVDGLPLGTVVKDGGVWKCKDGGCNIPDGDLQTYIYLLDKTESSTQGSLAAAQDVVASIYAVTNSIKSYPAISNVLFGKADFYKSWKRDMDKAFAPLLGSNWFPSAICEIDEWHWNDLEPEGKAVIKTVSGTYQAVASIQAERTSETSPILCHKNPDEEADEEFSCGSRQVCVDNTFCYADQDRDHEPDRNEPLKGYFYKITWAVSSPQDEALTPLIDENGVAVSFNIFLNPGAVPLYSLNGNIASPIQLVNGAKDKAVIIKYSTNVYDQACIRWNQAPRTITVPGGEEVEDVCFNIITSAVGQVNWERSGQSGASITASNKDVSQNTDW